MSRPLRLMIVAALAAAAPLPAEGTYVVPDSPPISVMTAPVAELIILGCRRHAAAKRQSHSIVVVDSGGHLVAALRMDGNPAGTMAFALQKAEAAATWGFATAQMEAAAKETPGFARAPGVVTVAGGVPVYSADGKTLVGAAAASGEAPADDEACAEAGIKAAGLRSERAR